MQPALVFVRARHGRRARLLIRVNRAEARLEAATRTLLTHVLLVCAHHLVTILLRLARYLDKC